ncbi:MAG: hypothetical protein KTR31_30465 [Myxococcales bacterium]|nr:hypothetical protein [Myxococcales bacterium]
MRVIAMLAAGAMLSSCLDDVRLCADADRNGRCDDTETCPLLPSEPAGNHIKGRMACMSPDDGVKLDYALRAFRVEVPGFGRATTNCHGEFFIPAPDLTEASAPEEASVSFVYDNFVPGPGGISTRLRVMDDFEAGWGGGFGHAGFDRTARATTSTQADGDVVTRLDTIFIDTSECELWRIGTDVIDDYHDVMQAPMPDGRLQFMRRAGVFGTTPYVFYDHVDLASNILDIRPGRWGREHTMFHEAAHIVRDVFDGDEWHWHGDNVNFIYARCHTGREIFEEPYAFHEGFAQYWAEARHGSRSPANPTTTNYCGGAAGPRDLALTPGHMDWVELMIQDRLLALADQVGGGDPDTGDRIMVETLQANRGTIHSLFDFETALCAANPCGSLQRTTPPPTCPPGYSDHGLTCAGPTSHIIRHYRP